MSNQNTPERVAGLIEQECDSIKALLLAKNRAYGNSALDPVRIFSKSDPIEQIRVRIDDKLSRLSRGSSAGEDVEQDLLGYLVLLRVARKLDVVAPVSPVTSDTVEIHDLHDLFEHSDSNGLDDVFDPGPGYRLLRKGEVIQEGDEIWDFSPAKWVPCLLLGNEVCAATVRRKLAATPGPGYRLLGSDETVQEGDEFLGLASNQWIRADSTLGRVSDVLGEYPNIVAYRRKLAACPCAGERKGAPVE